MICYKDRTFCGSVTIYHTCNKELTLEQIQEAVELGLPIAYADYCGNDDDVEATQ